MAIGITKVRAEPAPSLPSITAQQLVASSIAALRVPHAVSGDVRTRLDLGLPEIPASLSGPAGQLGVTSVLGSLVGNQRFRVWSSPDGIRVQHIIDLQEQDLVANPSQAWFWDSATATATKLRAAGVTPVLPAPPTNDPAQIANADPMVLAKHLLALASTCGSVSVGDPAVIAGRDAYVVHLTPASSRTLVGDVAIAIDAQTRLPLDVSITARGASAPALEAGFTSVSFGPIDPSMFVFVPPTDATVRDVTDQVASAVTTAAHRKDVAPGDGGAVTDGIVPRYVGCGAARPRRSRRRSPPCSRTAARSSLRSRPSTGGRAGSSSGPSTSRRCRTAPPRCRDGSDPSGRSEQEVRRPGRRRRPRSHGRARGALRLPRSERRGQDDDDPDGPRADPPDRWRDRGPRLERDHRARPARAGGRARRGAGVLALPLGPAQPGGVRPRRERPGGRPRAARTDR